mgnify:CR=1 FL=1
MSPHQPKRGNLHDSYHAALQHSHDEPDEDDLVIGVVREPMYGIQKYIDENWPELAPSRQLLDEFKAKADEIGHNAAVDAVDFRERYRDSLDGAAQERINKIVSELRSGRDVWVVCYENTDDKFCHRDILTDEIMQVVNNSGNDTTDDASGRPSRWPETYSAAGRSASCPHQMHWDSSQELYRCIYGCGEIDEIPPENVVNNADS